MYCVHLYSWFEPQCDWVVQVSFRPCCLFLTSLRAFGLAWALQRPQSYFRYFFFSLNIKTFFFSICMLGSSRFLGDKIQKKKDYYSSQKKNILEFACGLLMPRLCGFNFTICFSTSLLLDSLSSSLRLSGNNIYCWGVIVWKHALIDAGIS